MNNFNKIIYRNISLGLNLTNNGRDIFFYSPVKKHMNYDECSNSKLLLESVSNILNNYINNDITFIYKAPYIIDKGMVKQNSEDKHLWSLKYSSVLMPYIVSLDNGHKSIVNYLPCIEFISNEEII